METRASRTCSTLSLPVDRSKSARDIDGPGDDKEGTRESKTFRWTKWVLGCNLTFSKTGSYIRNDWFDGILRRK